MQYDVFVVGAKDPSPVAQMHLSARLADYFHVSAVQIAQAMASRNLRAGHGVDEAQARILCDQLAAMGAVTELRPSVSGGRRQTGTGATQMPPKTNMGASRTVAGRGPAMPGTMAGQPQAGTTAGRLPPLTALGAPATSVSAPPTMAAFGSTPGTDIVGRDPFAQSTPGPIGSASQATSGQLSSFGLSAPAPTSGAAGAPLTQAGPPGLEPGRDPFAAPTGDLPKLELVPRGPKVAGPGASVMASSPDELPRRQPSLSHEGGGGPARLAADSEDSGVALADGKVHTVRCAQHGLYYDKRVSSGCRKCLAPARNRAAKLMDNSLGAKARRLRDSPMKHAMVGLSLALFIGLVPAALHAMGVGLPEIRRLRDEQVELSRQIGTKKVLDRFHELDKQVRDRHGTHMRNTALIWIGLGGLSLFGWYKIT